MSAKKEGGTDVELPERKKRILKAIVESYINTAEPDTQSHDQQGNKDAEPAGG